MLGMGKELLTEEGKVLRGQNRSMGGFMAGGEMWGQQFHKQFIGHLRPVHKTAKGFA
jgi:hypothetical protein